MDEYDSILKDEALIRTAFEAAGFDGVIHFSYDWNMDGLRHALTLNMAECPPGDEWEWVYIVANMALEAEIRLAKGEYDCSEAEMLQLWLALQSQTQRIQHIDAVRHTVNEN